MELSLDYRRNGTGHKDIFLHFAGKTWIADSYYLGDDNGLPEDSAPAPHTQNVLRGLLQQWAIPVDGLNPPGVAYLPYDFSDQYTAWLRCVRSEEEVAVCWGWAEVEAWSFSPSNPGDLMTGFKGFKAEGPEVHVPYDDLVEAVHAMLAAQD